MTTTTHRDDLAIHHRGDVGNIAEMVQLRVGATHDVASTIGRAYRFVPEPLGSILNAGLTAEDYQNAETWEWFNVAFNRTITDILTEFAGESMAIKRENAVRTIVNIVVSIYFMRSQRHLLGSGFFFQNTLYQYEYYGFTNSFTATIRSSANTEGADITLPANIPVTSVVDEIVDMIIHKSHTIEFGILHESGEA